MSKFLTLAAIASLTSAPASANLREAALATSGDQARTHSGLFVGATYRVGFDRKANAPRGRGALTLSGMTYRPQTSELRIGEGIAVGISGQAKPALLIGGADVGQLGRRANLSGRATALIVVGVAVVAVAVLVATACDNDCQNAKAE